MSEYVYNSRYTFLARCWWQSSAVRIEPESWADSKRHLSTVWVESGSGGARGHRDRYLQAEPDGVLEKNLNPSDYQSATQQYYELFWFGAYAKGSYAHDKPLYYEIRPADRVWAVSRWVLDHSDNFLSGYVGAWPASEPKGADRKPDGARLWRIDGLAREGLKQGDRHCNLQLLAPGGSKVCRYQRAGGRFFNTREGEAGFIALEILSIPHQFGEL